MTDNQKSKLINKVESIFGDISLNELNRSLNGHCFVQQEYATLFADFGGSTQLIDEYDKMFSTWLLKSYLSCVSSLIQHHGGMITAFEGDGLMGVFTGSNKESNAVKCAFNIQWTLTNIIQPKIDELFAKYNYKAYQVVGIDTSELTPIETEIWDNYDILWIGRSANYSANLTRINNPKYSTYITNDVFQKLSKELQGNEQEIFWDEMSETLNTTKIFRSNRILINNINLNNTL